MTNATPKTPRNRPIQAVDDIAEVIWLLHTVEAAIGDEEITWPNERLRYGCSHLLYEQIRRLDGIMNYLGAYAKEARDLKENITMRRN